MQDRPPTCEFPELIRINHYLYENTPATITEDDHFAEPFGHRDGILPNQSMGQ